MMKKDSILYLIKIGAKKYLKDTVSKGQFYMNTCEAFRQMAISNYGDLVGDLQECSFPHGTEFHIGDTAMTPFDKDDPESSSLCCGANYCIYCTYAVCANHIPNTAIISSDVFTGIVGDKNPSEYCILLFKYPVKIIDKIVEELSGRGLSGRCDFVNYDDHDYISQYRFPSNDYILDLCFHKRKDFAQQNEFRIATINSEDAPISDLFIGELASDEYMMEQIEMGKNLHIITGKNATDILFVWR